MKRNHSLHQLKFAVMVLIAALVVYGISMQTQSKPSITIGTRMLAGNLSAVRAEFSDAGQPFQISLYFLQHPQDGDQPLEEVIPVFQSPDPMKYQTLDILVAVQDKIDPESEVPHPNFTVNVGFKLKNGGHGTASKEIVLPNSVEQPTILTAEQDESIDGRIILWRFSSGETQFDLVLEKNG